MQKKFLRGLAGKSAQNVAEFLAHRKDGGAGISAEVGGILPPWGGILGG